MKTRSTVDQDIESSISFSDTGKEGIDLRHLSQIRTDAGHFDSQCGQLDGYGFGSLPRLSEVQQQIAASTREGLTDTSAKSVTAAGDQRDSTVEIHGCPPRP